ncbi:MAG: Gfo/Idh/MocA family oxidoreductase [Saprospiraceae bacterium]|nr:Gfo/Idh/MocA family oxidoreductase [Saprospiraceae bacterium]
MNQHLTIGIIGAGGFAAFAAKAFVKIEGIRIKAVTDVNLSFAHQVASEVEALVYPGYEEMLADTEIDLIYIATPPFLHYAQSKQALLAGKHVICEKPAALKTVEAEELRDCARARGLLYTVNLMQRYNPLYATVKTIIDEQWLGDFVHGFFDNYASDEKLIPEHWFWNRQQSGGIFIEHGVHFFDMFEGWFGPGKLVHAMEIARDTVTPPVTDRVQAVVLYNNSPVNFYHGFNQPKVLDRQELRLQFDRGDITLYEWVPVKIRIHGLFTKEHFEKINQHFPIASIEVSESLASHDQHVTGKFKDIAYDALMTITSGDIKDKMDRYEQLVISMLEDQWAWIRDSTHLRIIDATNAVESLRIAEEATLQSKKY